MLCGSQDLAGNDGLPSSGNVQVGPQQIERAGLGGEQAGDFAVVSAMAFAPEAEALTPISSATKRLSILPSCVEQRRLFGGRAAPSQNRIAVMPLPA